MALVHKFIQDGDYYLIDVNSGSVHIIDELIYNMVGEDELLDKEDVINNLKDKWSKEEIEEGYEELLDLVKEEVLYSKDLYEEIAMAGDESESYIKALCLNVVHDCNLRCKYCFADEGEYKGCRKPMSAEVGKRAIDYVLENSGNIKNIEVDLFGGEPLMVFDTIKEIVDYAKEKDKLYNKNIRFTMTTNATLLNDEIIDYIDKNMGNIILSIDGRKEVNDNVRIRVDGSGCYDRILPNIKKMVDRRDPSKQYYARGTFTRENTDFFEDVMALANEGFSEISIEPVVLPDSHNLSIRREDLPKIYEQYDMLYKEMLRRAENNDNPFKFYHFNIDLNGGPCVYKRIAGCGAGHEYVAITPDGDIYPCHQFVGNEEFLLGNINSGIKNKNLSKDFKNAHIYNKPKCKECWARFYCSGGCQANNFNFNGDIHVPYEIGCEMQKKRIECAIALKAKTM
ncbi:MAG: thioether cross-link-forming SCIFF peptide maturase [Sarcina ventriculi]|uniref:Anaerobic sulfatase-maturating enzyme homolog YdeM n=1 Tax=Sarcina ventriculi TaxID=1267 RepID=A0ABM9UQU3_SARVE|nr:thioether cross-link-forming SCIFF peptide maturase [Sarcina ventriculi]MDO4402235.1 thioether cross-link-forming SCIFF peptide maturase [Clostridiaceae bacterium]MBU5321508.1 thioether cross-link-forming SCIFF peptide maturase [Sarcina ventriculi]MDD7373314.1 thioether cross-link-forming SCIFF peptide maturase [Sarcina ventriculi]MDY7062988.1 thioether cross-link-forming SCIFF peptide maturase [Sarcina ventriculi]CUN98144.1 Anaerobic sulfatase-maturating enzyme homolog YdeM [Sarcina ventri